MIKSPTPLLTIRRISQITGVPVSALRRALDEHPEIRPAALADYRPIYDNLSLRQIAEIFARTEVAQ